MKTISLHPKLALAHSEVEDGNMDERFSDRSVIITNRRKFLSHFDLNPKTIIEGKQVHGIRILPLNTENSKMWFGINIPGVDGFITDQTDFGLVIKVADCVPLVLYDPTHHAVGLFHVGWKGAVASIHLKGLEELTKFYQTNPGDIIAWFGPHARKCCFTSSEKPKQIDDEAWSGFITESDRHWSVDLLGYLQKTLNEAGVKKKNMKDDSTCTVETPTLYSYDRSKKTGEPEARWMVLAKLQ